MTQPRATRSITPVRRGAALIYVLVVLSICGVLVTLLAEHLFMEQRVLKNAAWRVQARWLAEAGLARAEAARAADANYMGETWQIAGNEMPSGQPATVTIVLQTELPEPLMEVVATYPSDSDQRATYRKQVTLLDQGAQP